MIYVHTLLVLSSGVVQDVLSNNNEMLYLL